MNELDEVDAFLRELDNAKATSSTTDLNATQPAVTSLGLGGDEDTELDDAVASALQQTTLKDGEPSTPVLLDAALDAEVEKLLAEHETGTLGTTAAQTVLDDISKTITGQSTSMNVPTTDVSMQQPSTGASKEPQPTKDEDPQGRWDAQLAQLCQMGYDTKASSIALQETGGNLENAIAFLVAQQDRLTKEPGKFAIVRYSRM
jgi:hypothetical protein